MHDLKKAISIKSRLEELQKMRDQLTKMFKKLKLGEDIIIPVVLSIDEAVSNIIEHGFKLKSTGRITMSIDISKDRITVKIQDNTTKFDPKQVPLTTPLQRIKERKQRGLGLIIIRKCMDGIYYRYTNDKKNELTLIKYIK
ncbi:MAG: ATP-binding protein [Planctomycetes bacterium]|nr:ATP-binding protein [Planctomycetota bacterium]